MSSLPAAAGIINQFISSPRDLILNIDIDISTSESDLTIIDFAPLTVLGAASLLIPYINLYVHAGILRPAITHAQLISLLEDYEDIMGLVKAGVLVTHPGKTAPDA